MLYFYDKTQILRFVRHPDFIVCCSQTTVRCRVTKPPQQEPAILGTLGQAEGSTSYTPSQGVALGHILDSLLIKIQASTF